MSDRPRSTTDSAAHLSSFHNAYTSTSFPSRMSCPVFNPPRPEGLSLHGQVYSQYVIFIISFPTYTFILSLCLYLYMYPLHLTTIMIPFPQLSLTYDACYALCLLKLSDATPRTV